MLQNERWVAWASIWGPFERPSLWVEPVETNARATPWRLRKWHCRGRSGFKVSSWNRETLKP